MKARNVKIDIDHVAKLASLELTGGEKKTFKKQLAQILAYVEQIESVDTQNVQPAYNVSQNKNVQRKDKIGESLSGEEALMNAKAVKAGQFVTKGVFLDE